MIRTTAFLLFAFSFCVAAHAQSKIIGGSNVAEGAHPWMASVGSKSGGSTNIFNNQFCGGMLVGPNHVLTAAHCVEFENANGLEVVVGVTNLSNVPGTARRRNVTQIIMHPNYQETSNGNLLSDVALLVLDSPITDITPISIATSPTSTAGTLVKAIGWGDTTDDEFTVDYPTALKQVEMQTVSLSQLQSEFGSSITAQHLGAFAVGKDTCQGDSGGPLFTESPLTLVGITSFGEGCADQTAGVYADVGHFSQYINSIIDVPSTLGDVNRDGDVNFADITPFILVLTSGVYQVEADIDTDGDVDFFDIQPFTVLLRTQ